MGRAARPLHDPGNHRSVERGSNPHTARCGSLRRPAKPAGERENDAALTPTPGARSIRLFTLWTVVEASAILKDGKIDRACELVEKMGGVFEYKGNNANAYDAARHDSFFMPLLSKHLRLISYITKLRKNLKCMS